MSSALQHLISKVPPLKRLAATTACSTTSSKLSSLNISSISDPYLSFAKLFSEEEEPTDLGALIIFSSTIAPLPQSEQQFLLTSLKTPIPTIIIPPPILTLAEAIKEAEANPLWDSFDFENEGESWTCWDDVEEDVKVTVWLQKTLDDECGGWKNTFG
ncbi:hypothetical protein TrLO_g13831 [Triparma laevis f. longispina]|uniref:Uncharacterized protein n=1 Tax=Triparma laevis f. longispina TaxID=1714387 RepID=A0A9W7AMI7_9STRA|nr:hypothetical protein TrLO_g13831 [Triparma laevis f. longispina]